MHDVTLGATGTSSEHDRHPKIGDGVFLAAKCTVLGNIEVGKGATVAASALVNKAVPPGYTAVGVPAKLIPPPKGSQYWKPELVIGKAELTGGRERHFERFRQTF
jgi:serine acetyltransferase